MSDRPLRRGNWSVQELERLRQLLPRRGVEGTSLLLRRSEASVLRKALQLLRVPARRGPWTASDDARLRECWGAVDARLLGPMLGRPIAEVRKRVVELRSRLRSSEWSRDDRKMLKELYGTRADEDLEIALGRPRADIAAMAHQLCLAKDKRFAAHAGRDPRPAKPLPGRLGGELASPVAALPIAGVPRSEMPRWTWEQTEKLRAIYAENDNLAVARALGRTVASVANKANLLGLKKCPRVLADIGRANIAARYQERSAGD